VDVQELSADGLPDPGDLSIIQSMILGNDLTDLGSRPASIVVIDSPAATLSVGSTTHASVHLENQNSLYTSGFGVVFSVDVSSTGTATLFGGDGADSGGRYDFTATAPDASARIVIRADSPGTIYINATVPQCGTGTLGKSAPAISIPSMMEITAE